MVCSSKIYLTDEKCTRKERGCSRDADAEVDDGKAGRNRMQNNAVQEMAIVVEASKKAQERRLYWYGYVMRRVTL